MTTHTYQAFLQLKDNSEVLAKEFEFEHEDYELDDAVALKRVREEEGLELTDDFVSLGSAMVARNEFKGVRVALLSKAKDG